MFSSYPNQIMNFWQGYHNHDSVSLSVHHTGGMLQCVTFGDVGFDHLGKVCIPCFFTTKFIMESILWRDTL